ncbi:MAG TPA: hypothetical protein VH083_23270 [Myxococcales bacterium]|nr:hypothetical protein [Myxococcales bacterium]
MLNASVIIAAWEGGQGRSPAGKALAILEAAGGTGLLALPVGEVAARLLALRERAFGQVLDCRASCPVCPARVEFSVDAAALQLEPPARAGELSLSRGGWEVRFRLPIAGDLLEASRQRDPRALLIERCVLEARSGGQPVPARELPGEVLQWLGDALEEADPRGDLQIDLSCPACAHQWREPFDAGSFLWSELAGEARRLFRDVDALARAYGWTEPEIFALSARRRQEYLELVSA